MDDGPWTALGTLGWFLGVWVVMMAAMMFPSLAPTVALYSRMTKDRVAPLLFTAGYLVTWGAVGLAAFAVARAGGAVAGDVLAWDRAGAGLPARQHHVERPAPAPAVTAPVVTATRRYSRKLIAVASFASGIVLTNSTFFAAPGSSVEPVAGAANTSDAPSTPTASRRSWWPVSYRLTGNCR